MKKLTLFFAAAVVAMAFAADADAQISVGAGYGLANHNLKIGGEKMDSEDSYLDTGMSGFWIGATYDYNIMKASWGDLAVQSGLTYGFYGKKFDEEEVEGSRFKTSRRDHYLDIPVNVKWSYDVLPGKLKAHAFAGPAFSFGLGSNVLSKTESGDDYYKSRYNLYNGKVKTEYRTGDQTGKESDKSDPLFSMFDLKFGIGIGATVLDLFDVKLGYNIGLLNRYKGEDKKNIKSHTDVFYLGVAYNF